jgi:peroxiredoxin family protein
MAKGLGVYLHVRELIFSVGLGLQVIACSASCDLFAWSWSRFASDFISAVVKIATVVIACTNVS